MLFQIDSQLEITNFVHSGYLNLTYRFIQYLDFISVINNVHTVVISDLLSEITCTLVK